MKIRVVLDGEGRLWHNVDVLCSVIQVCMAVFCDCHQHASDCFMQYSCIYGRYSFWKLDRVPAILTVFFCGFPQLFWANCPWNGPLQGTL